MIMIELRKKGGSAKSSKQRGNTSTGFMERYPALTISDVAPVQFLLNSFLFYCLRSSKRASMRSTPMRLMPTPSLPAPHCERPMISS